jgi:hypothetical protein
LAQRDVRGREPRSARGALQASARTAEHEFVVITRVTSIPATAWPTGWDDVEVVDSVLVEEPPAVLGSDGVAAAVYNGFGRVADTRRYGRLVSVLA